MTTSHPPTFTLTVQAEPTALVIHVGGDLDYETCDELMRTADQHLADRRTAQGRLLDLRVDFTGLDSIDSMGLSTLLMIRRRTDAAGVRLHLDGRPPGLERLLEITGTLDYLTAPCDAGKGERRPGAG
ncbi:STAS domain-containing protein [Streptomyces sp. NPDC006446]|uniref:STAS domain-containing protein n=1 Tax=Streptomyces sp. NPDC006446 TaxID=3154301 RepID=UPI0033BA3C4C